MADISIKVTQASLNQTALDWSRNLTNIYAAIDEAVLQGSDILALEELALTGYEANDEFQRVDNNQIHAALEDIASYAAAYNPNLIISVGHPWRVQMRDISAEEGLEFERTKEPLYDRLSLPFNVQSIITDGKIQGMTAKSNLFNDERGYEKRYFNEWSSTAANRIGGVYGTISVPLDASGNTVPFGNPVFHVSDGKNSLNIFQPICETKWSATQYDGYPYDNSRYETDNLIPSVSRYLGSKDGLVFIIPNASPPARDKIDKHRNLNELASHYGDVVIDTDGLGSSGSTFAQFGHRLIAQKGKTITSGNRMSFARVSTTTSTVQISNAPSETADKAHVRFKHEFKNGATIPQENLIYKQDENQRWDSPKNPDRHFEEVIRYTAFWLFDYMRKSGSKGIAEALSGGADSGFNSTIVSVMVHMGMKELGPEAFCDELNLKNKAEIMRAYEIGGTQAAIDRCMQEFLTAVYMGTNNNPTEHYTAAKFLIEGGKDPVTGEDVKGIGGKFMNRNVQDLLNFYGVIYAVETTVGMDPMEKHNMTQDIAAYLNASPYDITPEERADHAQRLKKKYPQIQDMVTAADGAAYENIQARGREVVIMLVANKEKKMAVANPNLDEARNAYSTFGGDLHSGTINLNAHLDKTYELAIMRYLYEHGVQGVMPPVKALAAILRNAPSAGLMPLGKDGKLMQRDEDDLERSFEEMNYIISEVLYGRIKTYAGERRPNATEVFEKCKQHKMFEHFDDNVLFNKIHVSYSRFYGPSQHKIHASPIGPTFGRNVDHQTSLRTPNLNSQSRDELTQLAVGILFKWAEQDNLGWSEEQKKTLDKRAWQDEEFIKQFDHLLWVGKKGMSYDLSRLYTKLKEKGWDGILKPLDPKHPINIIYRLENTL